MGSVANIRSLFGCLLICGATTVPSGHGRSDVAERASTASAESLPINPTGIAVTPDGRQLLRYLVSCALPEGVVLHAEVEGQKHSFAGSLGLAPGWMVRGLTLGEQRWVSACILARTNFFGQEVAISMRASAPAPPALQSTPEERETFTLFEGGFFGNIFQGQPRAFACAAERTAEQDADRSLRDRVCTEPSASTLPTGESLTRCGFIHTGVCPNPESLTPGPHGHQLDGYREVVFTYLRPAGP